MHWYCDACHIESVNGISKTLKECANGINELKRITSILSALCHSSHSQPQPSMLSASQTDNVLANSPHVASAIVNVNNVPMNISNPMNNNSHTGIENMVIDLDKSINADVTDKTSSDLPLYSYVVSNGSVQSAKRKIDDQPSPIPNKIQKKNGDLLSNRAVQTSLPEQSNANSSNSTRITDETSCIYVSKFKPEIEDSMILRHLHSVGVIESTNVQCKRLVRTNGSGRKLTFVSFKIQVPSIHTNTVLNPLNWPKDTIVRMFEDKSSKVAQKPIEKPIDQRISTKSKPDQQKHKLRKQNDHDFRQNNRVPTKFGQHNRRMHNNYKVKRNNRAQMIDQARNIERANWYQPTFAPIPHRSTPFFPSAAFSQPMMPYPCYLPQMPPIYQQQMNPPQLMQ